MTLQTLVTQTDCEAPLLNVRLPKEPQVLYQKESAIFGRPPKKGRPIPPALLL